jgi:hypothetical protein
VCHVFRHCMHWHAVKLQRRTSGAAKAPSRPVIPLSNAYAEERRLSGMTCSGAVHLIFHATFWIIGSPAPMNSCPVLVALFCFCAEVNQGIPICYMCADLKHTDVLQHNPSVPGREREGAMHLCEHGGVVGLLPGSHDGHEEQQHAVGGHCAVQVPWHAICEARGACATHTGEMSPNRAFHAYHDQRQSPPAPPGETAYYVQSLQCAPYAL